MNQKTLDYCIHSYAFLLPRDGVFTPDFWADEIEKAYREATLPLSVFPAEIRKIKGQIVRNSARTEIIQN